MLKIGDRVVIDATGETGIVHTVHPHEVIVRVDVPDGHAERSFAYESLRRDPTMSEASNFIDH